MERVRWFLKALKVFERLNTMVVFAGEKVFDASMRSRQISCTSQTADVRYPFLLEFVA